MSRRAWNVPVPIDHPGRITPGMARAIQRWVGPAVRLLWRPTLTGTGNLPTDGPFLLVANHSAGTGLAEILSLACLWLDAFGTDRPLAGMALPTDFQVPGNRDLVRALGAIPSTREAAEQALGAGVPVLVFPGGDYEALRPIWQVNRVDFGGRVGFLRIARALRVPVLPLGIRGGHMTGPVLFRSRLLATLLVTPRLIGVKRWGISLFGALVAFGLLLLPLPLWLRALLVFGWLGSPMSFPPWIPWTVRMRVGPALTPEALFGDDVSEEGLRSALTRVEAAVQAEVDRG